MDPEKFESVVNDMKLRKDEKELRDAFERGELQSVPHAALSRVRQGCADEE